MHVLPAKTLLVPYISMLAVVPSQVLKKPAAATVAAAARGAGLDELKGTGMEPAPAAAASSSGSAVSAQVLRFELITVRIHLTVNDDWSSYSQGKPRLLPIPCVSHTAVHASCSDDVIRGILAGVLVTITYS